MIKCNLSKQMGIKDVDIQIVSDSTGLNRGTVSNLKHNKVKRIDYDTLEKLCDYFDCTPGDMLEIVKKDDK